uniref:Uncharacterized protein n=1 Tax=Rhizophora mucronata TaxID=61149 RepID=A0A2P2Q2L3_RHIMU
MTYQIALLCPSCCIVDTSF